MTDINDEHLRFDCAFWEQRLLYADWYVRVERELRALFFPVVHDQPRLKGFRNQVYELVGELVEAGRLPLALSGPNLDGERKHIDTIVIHHTEEEPDIRLSKLSAIGLVRQYAFQYLENDVLGRATRGEPIWSGHFRQGRMVFFAYHWLIQPDGTAERLLDDGAIGWHAGNWEINTRSAGIALSGNYEHDTPPLVQIEGTARLIHEHYGHVALERVLGHHEVVVERTCPGAHFLHGWKDTLLAYLH